MHINYVQKDRMKMPNGYGSVTKLSGNRRKPYIVRKTSGFHYDAEKEKVVQEYLIIGYAQTRAEGLQMLAEYNKNPFNVAESKFTFEELYEKWASEKFETISESNIKAYRASFNACQQLHTKVFKEITLGDLQYVIDHCGKNYPTLKKIKQLLNQLYKYANAHEIINKDPSVHIDIQKHSSKNPNTHAHTKFSPEEVDLLWQHSENKYYQIILMLIYNGCRISEFLNLKKEDINLTDKVFYIRKSKTTAGIRAVPIAEKVLPFYQAWYDSSNGAYLLHYDDGRPFGDHNYRDSYFRPLVQQLGMNHNPHDTRHTCISMLTEAGVDDRIIKKIVGHSGTLTENVYTHLEIKKLLEAINKI